MRHICFVIIVCSRSEWIHLCNRLGEECRSETVPYDIIRLRPNDPLVIAGCDIVFCKSGWGKISAAAATQYCIDQFKPDVILNIGTCGGMEGVAKSGEILLAERTVVYDIEERMGDFDQAIQHYSSAIDLDWIPRPFPSPVRVTTIATADQDLDPDKMSWLLTQFGAHAADWESGAIAYICALNRLPCIILRGVSDIVGLQRSEAYENPDFFHESSRVIITSILDSLPSWIPVIVASIKSKLSLSP